MTLRLFSVSSFISSNSQTYHVKILAYSFFYCTDLAVTEAFVCVLFGFVGHTISALVRGGDCDDDVICLT